MTRAAFLAGNEPKYLNTPRLVADQNQATVWKWDQQEPFGNNPADENPSGLGAFDLPLRLPGQAYDKEAGLYQNGYRDYWAEGGRYVQSDPVGMEGGVNTYTYVEGSPTMFVDPAGLLKWYGSFEMEFVGYGIWRGPGVGGIRGKFKLTSECDIDGNQAEAEVTGLAPNVGKPWATRRRGFVTFEDGESRAKEESLRGRFAVRSLGYSGPFGNLMAAPIFLGKAVSTGVRVSGGGVAYQFSPFRGFADTTSFVLGPCRCRGSSGP